MNNNCEVLSVLYNGGVLSKPDIDVLFVPTLDDQRFLLCYNSSNSFNVPKEYLCVFDTGSSL